MHCVGQNHLASKLLSMAFLQVVCNIVGNLYCAVVSVMWLLANNGSWYRSSTLYDFVSNQAF
jgi:hypothetical protein